MADLRDIANSTRFLMSPQSERAKVLQEFAPQDEEFMALPESEKAKVMNYFQNTIYENQIKEIKAEAKHPKTEDDFINEAIADREQARQKRDNPKGGKGFFANLKNIPEDLMENNSFETLGESLRIGRFAPSKIPSLLTMKDNIASAAKGFLKDVNKDPGKALAGVVNSIAGDLPTLGLGKVLGIGRLASGATALTRGVKGAAIGLATGTAANLNQQIHDTGHGDVGKAAGEALPMTAGGFALAALLKGKSKLPPKDIPPEAPPEEVAEHYKEEPNLYEQWNARRAEAQAKEIDTAKLNRNLQKIYNAENKAHELLSTYDKLHGGTVSDQDKTLGLKAVEKALKADPLAAKALDALLERRRMVMHGFNPPHDAPRYQGELLPAELENVKTPTNRELIDSHLPPVKQLAHYAINAANSSKGKVAAVAATGILASQFLPEDQKKGLEVAGLAVMLTVAGDEAHLPESVLGKGDVPIGVALKTSKYSLKSLDSLPENMHTIPKKLVREKLQQQGIGKAEKELVEGVLAQHEGEEVKAKDLVAGFKLATGDLTLKKDVVPDYQDYGMERIGRKLSEGPAGDPLYDENGLPKSTSPNNAETRLYKSPDSIALGPSEHFPASNVFGWTRSFKEGDVRHVVEVQSEVMQGKSKDLTPGWVKNIEDQIAHFTRLKNNNNLDPHNTNEVNKLIHNYTKILAEHKAAVATAPLTKTWPQRLLQEEFHNAREAGEPVIRIATGDTVAKVEGWPKQENGALYSEHEGIKARYDGPIRRYLTALGGKEVKDDYGHTWIETPVPRGPTRMLGYHDPELTTWLAALGLGAAAGAAFLSKPDHREVGAEKGAALAALSVLALTRTFPKMFKGMVENNRDTIAEHSFQMHRQNIVRAGVQAAVTSGKLVSLVPDTARRELLFKAIDEGKTHLLTGKDKEFTDLYSKYMKGMNDAAVAAGVYREGRDNYITHILNFPKKASGPLADLLGLGDNAPRGGGLGTYSPYAQGRKFSTAAELEAAGHTLLTKDPADIIRMYSASMTRAIEAAKLFTNLKKDLSVEGKPLVMDGKKAPREYVKSDVPGLAGMKVHPGLVPWLKFLNNTRSPYAFVRAVEGIASVHKRLLVSFSGFHLKTLVDVYTVAKDPSVKKVALGVAGAVAGAVVGKAFGSNDPEWAILGAVAGYSHEVVGFLNGRNAYLKALLEQGDMHPVIDRMIKGDMVVTLDKAHPSIEDAGVGFYHTLKSMQEVLNKDPVIGRALSKTIDGVAATQHKLDRVTWPRMHTGASIDIFEQTFQKLMANNAWAREKNPKVELLSEDDAAKIAGSYTRNFFGGLNWEAAAREASTRFGKAFTKAAFSPAGRRALRLLMFAPDWTISVLRSAIEATGEGTGFLGLQGLLKPQTLADLHRQTLLRSALYYYAVANTINYARSGHSIMDNEDKLTIDNGDGTKEVFFKHATEFLRYLQSPQSAAQEVANKLGVLPKTAAGILSGKQYINIKGHAPDIQTGPLAYAASQFAPIGLGPAGAALWDYYQGVPVNPKEVMYRLGKSFMGTPIQGITNGEKQDLKDYKDTLKFLQDNDGSQKGEDDLNAQLKKELGAQ